MTSPIIEIADRVTELQTLAEGAAKRVSASWPDAVEPDDLAQEIVMRLLESPGALDRVFEEDEPTRKAFLIKVGHQAASEMFQDYERFSGNYTYDTAIVRGLLEAGAILAEPDEFTPEIVDLREGMENLTKGGSPYVADLVNRFVHDLPETYEARGRQRVSRAVAALTVQMNRIGAERRKRHTEGPGTRTVITNATAYVINRQQINGDYNPGERNARNL